MLSRKNPDIGEIIDQRFAEFKATLFNDLKKELDDLIVKEKDGICKYITSKKEELKSFCINTEYAESLNEIQKHVKKLKADNDANKSGTSWMNFRIMFVDPISGCMVLPAIKMVIETVKS